MCFSFRQIPEGDGIFDCQIKCSVRCFTVVVLPPSRVPAAVHTATGGVSKAFGTAFQQCGISDGANEFTGGGSAFELLGFSRAVIAHPEAQFDPDEVGYECHTITGQSVIRDLQGNDNRIDIFGIRLRGSGDGGTGTSGYLLQVGLVAETQSLGVGIIIDHLPAAEGTVPGCRRAEYLVVSPVRPGAVPCAEQLFLEQSKSVSGILDIVRLPLLASVVSRVIDIDLGYLMD